MPGWPFFLAVLPEMVLSELTVFGAAGTTDVDAVTDVLGGAVAGHRDIARSKERNAVLGGLGDGVAGQCDRSARAVDLEPVAVSGFASRHLVGGVAHGVVLNEVALRRRVGAIREDVAVIVVEGERVAVAVSDPTSHKRSPVASFPAPPPV